MIPTPNHELAKRAIVQDIIPPRSSKREKMINALEDNGLSVSDIARNISTVANYADDGQLKLRANELASKFFGLLNDEEAQKSTVINIIVDGNVDVLDICTPRG